MDKIYNYRVVCSAEGYETTDFVDYQVAIEYYNKLKAAGISADFEELN